MSEAAVRDLLDAWRSAERSAAAADAGDRPALDERAERAHQAYLDAVDVAAKARRAAASRPRGQGPGAAKT